MGTVWDPEREALDFPLAIAIPAVPVSIMLRCAGKRRALSVLEKHEICRKRLEPEHAKVKLSDFGKNFIDDEVGNYVVWV